MPTSQDDIIITQFEEALTQAALSPSTVVNYLADLRAFLRWVKAEFGAGFTLLQTNQEHVRHYRHHLARELKRAASTINRHLMALRKFFSFALDAGFIGADPTGGVALIQGNGQIASRPITEAEIAKLLEAAQQGSRAGLVRRDVAILMLLIHTGLKVGEIIDLKKDDLIFDNPGVHLQICDANDQSKRRHLPLQGSVCQALNDYLQVRPKTNANQFFLNQEGRAVSKRTVQRVISDCAKTAGLEGVSAQSIRRTFAMHLLSETQDIGLVSERLGHQSQSITEQYLAVHAE